MPSRGLDGPNIEVHIDCRRILYPDPHHKLWTVFLWNISFLCINLPPAPHGTEHRPKSKAWTGVKVLPIKLRGSLTLNTEFCINLILLQIP